MATGTGTNSSPALLRLEQTDLRRTTKAVMVKLCKDLGLDHTGLKSTLETRLERALVEHQPQQRRRTGAVGDSENSGNSIAGSSTALSAPLATVTTTAPPGITRPITSTTPAFSSPIVSTSATLSIADLQAIATRAAQAGASQAMAQILGSAALSGTVAASQPSTTADLAPSLIPMQAPAPVSLPSLPMLQPGMTSTSIRSAPLPAQLHSITASQPPHQWQSTPLTLPPVLAPTLYQPPAATATEIQRLQASLGALQPGPPHHLQLAPASHTLPTLPSKLITKVHNGEFIDFAEILHALECEEGDEPPVQLEVGDGQQLTLSRKPKRREVKDFCAWSRCFCVYASAICCRQPARGPDLFSYHYLIACASWEFLGNAWLTYDTAFRRKAAQFHISTWGERDLQLYNKVFVGVRRRNAAHCAICLSTAHSTADCGLYQGGPAKKSKSAPAGPKTPGVPWHEGREVCLNWNRGKCADAGCPRAHVCSTRGCQGPHKSPACPHRRVSPRKRT